MTNPLTTYYAEIDLIHITPFKTQTRANPIAKAVMGYLTTIDAKYPTLVIYVDRKVFLAAFINRFSC